MSHDIEIDHYYTSIIYQYQVFGTFFTTSTFLHNICRNGCCAAAQVVGSRRGRIGAVEEGTLPGDWGWFTVGFVSTLLLFLWLYYIDTIDSLYDDIYIYNIIL